MDENQEKNHWYLLTGLIVGLVIGVLISLLVAPVVNADALPPDLSADAKADYREKIALAYSANYDLERAISRLELLEDSNPVGGLISQAQESLAMGAPEPVTKALGDLATRLSELLGQ